MKILLLSVFAVVPFAYSRNVEIKSIKELASYVNEDTLVIFDLDNTVFHAAKEDCHADRYYEKILSEKKAGTLSGDKKQRIYQEWEESQKGCPVELVEVEALSEIKQIQERNIKVMALTARGLGSVDSTLEQLGSVGISFRETALSMSPVEFRLGSQVEFNEGVLFASPSNPKGEVLTVYFEIIGHQPKRIVFVDDLIENLQSLETAFPTIEFIGLYYPLLANRQP